MKMYPLAYMRLHFGIYSVADNICDIKLTVWQKKKGGFHAAVALETKPPNKVRVNLPVWYNTAYAPSMLQSALEFVGQTKKVWVFGCTEFGIKFERKKAETLAFITFYPEWPALSPKNQETSRVQIVGLDSKNQMTNKLINFMRCLANIDDAALNSDGAIMK
jgi:hypothetical protein